MAPKIITMQKFFKSAIKNVQEAHFLFLVISIPAIIVFIAILPPAWGLDEQVHTARTYQISERNFYPDSIKNVSDTGLYGGYAPSSLVEVLNYGHLESNSVPREKPYFKRQDIRDKQELEAKLHAKLDPGYKVVYEFGASGPYSPIVYAPGSVGMFIGRKLDLNVGNMINLAKVFQAASYLALCFLSLWLLRKHRARWLIFILALLPSSIFQASTINADTFTIGMALVFLAILIDLFTRKKPLQRSDIGLLAVVTPLLMFSKPSYSLFAGILLFLPTKPLFKDLKHKAIVAGSILAVAALVFVVFSLQGMTYGDSILLYKDSGTAALIDPTDQIKWVLSHPLEYASLLWRTIVVAGSEWSQSFIGMLGYNTIATPQILTYVSVVSMVLAGLYGSKYSRNFALLLLGFGLLSALAVITILYATFNPVASDQITGVQGRYFIPCAPFILLGLMRLLPLEVSIRDKAAAPMFGIISFSILYITLYAYGSALF